MSKRVELTESQAQALADIYRRKERVQKEWEVALSLVGVNGEVTGGNLDDDPHLMVDDGSD